MRRWIPRFTLVAVAILSLTAAGQPSANAACPVLDVTCQVEDVNDAPIDTPLHKTIDPIVHPILDEVFDRVDDVVSEVPIDVPDPIGGEGGHHVGAPPGSDGPPSQAKPNPVDRAAHGPGTVIDRNPDGPGLTRVPPAVISATSGVAPSGSEDSTAPDPLGGTLGAVARGSALLLALFGLAVAFVAIQDRIDRHDPRLALAPVDSDVVEFA